MDFIDEYYADKDLSLLKKLTLVIPTYNRNYYLSRCLWYHAHFPFGEIIVADSSSEEKRRCNHEIIGRVCSQFNINILHLEYDLELDDEGNDYYWKWGDGVNHVKTEYSAVCIDKAFLCPDGVVDCLEKLEGDSEIVACRGGCYYLKEKRYNPVGKYYVTGTNSVVSSDETNPVRRLTRLLNLERPWEEGHLFSVTRSSIHKRLYRLLEDYDIKDIRTSEIVVSFFGSIYGQYQILFVPYAVRDIRKISRIPAKKRTNMTESADSRFPNLVSLLDKYPSYLSKLKKCVIQELKLLNRHSTNKEINDIFSKNLVNFDSTTHLEYKCLQRYSQLYQIWVEFIPPSIQNILIKYVLIHQKFLPIPPSQIREKCFDMIIKACVLYKDREFKDSPII